MRIIYLDSCATTPCDRDVVAAMSRCLLEEYGNPSSVHVAGKRALRLVQQATQQITRLLDARPDEIVFTSGATEANNLALLGSFDHGERDPINIVLSPIDHKSTLLAGSELERRGVRVKRLRVDRSGRISPDSVEECLDEHTRLVSVCHVNSEIGTIQPIEEIGRMCRERGVLFHVDAVQSVGRIPVSVRDIPIDLLSLSGHKIHGPMGIGALYVRSAIQRRLRPLLFGGEQHRLRSGTLPAPLIVGLGLACQKAAEAREASHAHATALRDHFFARLQERVTEVRLNTDVTCSVPHVLNVQLPGVSAETLVTALYDVAISSGSACNSKNTEPSYVLSAIGLQPAEASSSIRVCFGRHLSVEELDVALDRLVGKIRDITGAHGSW